MKKKLQEMTDTEKRSYVQKNMDKAWKTYEHWKKLSQRLSTGNWTKNEEIELQDLIMEKEHG